MFVVANYGFRDDEDEQKPIEVQATSPVIYYTTIGPPLPPFVRVLSVGLYQVCTTDYACMIFTRFTHMSKSFMQRQVIHHKNFLLILEVL